MSKPYSFVPFLECKPQKGRGYLRGRIKISIKTLTPVHISSGHYGVDDKNIYKRFVRNGENVIIPGTSLKGCVRNAAEAISYSCLSPSKNILNNFRNSLPSNKSHFGGRLCIICNMFGAMGVKSKLVFSDFKMASGKLTTINVPELYVPKLEKPLYRDENGKFKGYKFYYHGKESILEKGNMPYEFAEKDSEFHGEVIYRDLTEEQLSLLCFSLGLSKDIHLKIGYGKPAYYGSIETCSEDYFRIKAEEYKNNKDKLIQRNVNELIKILNYNNAKKSSDWVQTSPVLRTY